MGKMQTVVQAVLNVAQEYFAAAIEGEIKDWIGRGYTLDDLVVEYIDHPTINKAKGYRQNAWVIGEVFRVRPRTKEEKVQEERLQARTDHDAEVDILMDCYHSYREVEHTPETSAVLSIGHVLVKILKKLEDIHIAQKGGSHVGSD